MPANNLPHEIQWKVLDYLCIKDKKQYSLVSKHWREAAKHNMLKGISIDNEKEADMFIDLFEASPSTRNIIKRLTVRTDGIIDNVELYSKVIRLTPGIRELWVTRDAGELYQVIQQEIRHGHWQYLSYIGMYMHFGGAEQNLNQDYYALASAIKDRLSHLNLHISSLSDSSLSEIRCFQFPSLINRQTRFNSVRELECHSNKTTSIRSVDDALALCPNATEVKLEISNLDLHEERLMHVEPNTTIEILAIGVYCLSEAGLDYICRKFRKVKILRLRFSLYGIHDYRVPSTLDPLEISEQVAVQLADYVHSLDKCTLSIRGPDECSQLLYAFSLFQWQGQLTISLYSNYFRLEYNRFKPNLSELNIDIDIEDSFLERASVKDYLGQLNRLCLNKVNPNNHKIVPYCTQLQHLKMTYDEPCFYEGPLLPVTHLDLTNRVDDIDFLKQLLAHTPYLRVVRFLLGDKNNIEIDMPFIIFDSLWVACTISPSVKVLYLHLVQSNKETYHRSTGDSLCTIEAREFEAQELGVEAVKVKLVCRHIKRLGFGNHWGSLYIEHRFD